MKKLTILFISIATFIGCNTDEENLTLLESNKILEISDGFENGINTKLHYDKQNRVIKIIENLHSDNQADFYELHFKYENNTITESLTQSDYSYTHTYTLKNSRLTKANLNNEIRFYEYNTDGYLSKITIERLNNDPVYVVISYSGENISNVTFSSQNTSMFDNIEYVVSFNNEPRLSYVEFLGGAYYRWFLSQWGEAILYEQGLLGKKATNQILNVQDYYTNVNYSYGTDNNGKPNSFSSEYYSKITTWYYNYIE